MTVAVEIDAVRVQFGTYRAIREISFSVPRGQFTAIVGPTGCGKSSLLNVVAGLLSPAAGKVETLGSPVTSVNRQAGYMFQQDALLPWKTVLGNVQLGPLLRGMPRSRSLEEARLWIRRVGLAGFEHRYPHQLSGGQRKRGAMAQVLINRPPLLLMDEPFSALDVQTRALMENELLGLWQELEATVLFVTHDLEEAIALADRIILFTAGPEATLKGDYVVDLPRPRNVIEARFTPGFSGIHERLWLDLRTEVIASYERSRKAG
jgi:NitT/TauT family transport system ATP-binding protein